ncbi:hypothetical protein EDD28_0101 [Salana multivorans]|uniref:Calcineurin-like phosphoesterase family protein n=1 Tax=Salana multivorans TaxID=120377 RepID=A0A3N2D7W3_9MICO|nr:hypothetical protein [Salana multivorans]ROR95460.1 hypothetical protein EDD28_0013 [Salana multivorans]ROR95544.1 hypothetical protein EDD28_0101 [Salana multivorans]
MSLKDDLLAPPPAPPQSARTAERAFTRKLEVSGDRAEAEINAPEGTITDETVAEFLTTKGLDPHEWEASGFRSSEWTMPNGAVGESKRFSFVRRAGGAAGSTLPDLDDLHAAIERARAELTPQVVPLGGRASLVTIIADPQIGKVGSRGGAEEVLGRLEASRERFEHRARTVAASEIILVDAGDAVENFESAPQQDRTNDLQLTEQIRVWRRVLWTWVATAARLSASVKVIGVPSNHGAVRRGKAKMGPASDDYGIEVIAQVADMAAVNNDLYGHVEFFTPGTHEESVAIELAGGKVLGVAHGHQAGTADGLAKWLAGQALGRTPVGRADIAVFGHFHNLRIQTVGDDRWLFVAPTSDNGSDWFRNLSGADSAPGVLTFVVDEDGWRDLAVC